MRKLLGVMTVALLAVLAVRAEAALLISEVLYNEVSSPADGEWIEIYNTGPASIDLSNYKIGDEETMNPPTGENGGMWQFPAGATISAGEVQIVAVGAARFNTVYSFDPTYEVVDSNAGVPNMTHYLAWSDNTSDVINMANGNDQAFLIDGSDSLVDAVSWGNTFAFNPGLAATVADGQSYERINARIDTNSAGDWQLGSPSSPGTVPIPEPTSATLVGLVVIATACFKRRRID